MPRHENRLSREKSPYLLQHAHNPVDWYPWSEEAFLKAQKESKPVLLSIGYSTCHWCHVMEEESFENPSVAKVMNDSFVSIKVDREERPDIDSVYMSYVMAATGGGGWPMTVFLTPEKKPFFGGTYFPPTDRHGMPGFTTLLSSIADAWKTRKDEILVSADSAVQFLGTPKIAQAAKTVLDKKILEDAYHQFQSAFDSERGGFGGAPKFPRSHSLSLLLRYWKRTGEPLALEMAEKTLSAMARGGLMDQLEGGFHRYSTDAEWRVPHFEKMLYDQALLVRAYLEVYQITKKEEYARVARQTLDYVSTRMTGPEGGFFSAEDADSEDSSGKKREGAFYVWMHGEIDSLLGTRAAEIFNFCYGVLPEGNAVQDPHNEFGGKNILYAAHTADEAAEHFGLKSEEIAASLKNSRTILLNARSKRSTPYRDDKILTDWNGLMISSFAFASRVLEETRYQKAASAAADFLCTRLKDKKGRLYHRYRQGEAGIQGGLDDHAFLIEGLFALYEATFEERWLKEAQLLAAQMSEQFWDEAEGGFFMTAKDAEALFLRPKEVYDGAVPSGNSMAARDLLLLEKFTMNGSHGKRADALFQFFADRIAAEPMHYPQMLIALDFLLGPSEEIVIASEKDDPSLAPILREIFSRFLPNKIVLCNPAGEWKPLEGKAAVYVCRNYACALPAADLGTLKKLLTHPTEKR